MATAENERKRRTIIEIRVSKTSGEKIAYTSVPGYSSARWAEKHGHKNTSPVSMDTMIMHAQAVRRGAPHTFVSRLHAYQSSIRSTEL